MPSPFPGMDPFLEYPDVFPDLQWSFVTYLAEILQPQLPEPYFAAVHSRVWVDLPHDEFREPALEIRRMTGNTNRLVTVIQVVTILNKTPGESARDLYVRQQLELLRTEAHLVEIDLLRDGTHVTAVPLEKLQEKAKPFEYHVCVHRFDRWKEFAVYAIALNERLPAIPIPLLPTDGDIVVDLQQVFQRAYDAADYRRSVRYDDVEVVPPLPEKWRTWAADVVRLGIEG